MVNARSKIVVWMSWLFIWPVSVLTLYHVLEPSFAGRELDILSFAVLMVILSLFPLLVGDSSVFVVHGVGLAVFLYFGFFAEMLLTQLSVLFLLLKLRVGKTEGYRFPLNMLLFLTVSCASAAVYYILGGQHGGAAIDSSYDAVPIAGYAFTQILVNQSILAVLGKVLHRRKFRLFDVGFLWECLTSLLVFPIGLVLFKLYLEIGLTAIYFVGIPFIFISFMLMLYHNSREMNGYLQQTSEFGHELTGKLGVSEVLDVFVSRLSNLLPVDYIYVFDVVDNKQLELIRFYDREEKMSFPQSHLEHGEDVSGNTWLKQSGFHFSSKKEWKPYVSSYTPVDAESIMSLPVQRKNEIVGIISVYAKKRRAFHRYQFMIMEILANYLAVAMENARHYEKTKKDSEICPLTGLYNYRYFENYLQHVFDEMKTSYEKGPLSLILLDIDHFKSVNDTYGHESGNEILKELAERLSRTFDEHEGAVARYGGEEFVILLPWLSQDQCYKKAEEVRQTISGHPFSIREHILSQEGTLSVDITASVGIATFPHDCDEPLDLIRHADRAMYVGAKQQGRNRVAKYIKDVTTVE
ncbi:sensor domain-containing diguanylate cyclase [Thalassobacillus sp. CUG 92003]|uniref:sensor domain-containing diguanylate cyclase n=1 Tax=Thalassobacillus sp. CUG 92003 TaxID=2736641 RepID=UPI0015E64EA6|nr:sensor domain-containing diguanylate cyclase [Thalassobacillus sp. CUG 92003]